MSKLFKKGLPFIIALLSFCILFVYFFKARVNSYYASEELMLKHYDRQHNFFDVIGMVFKRRLSLKDMIFVMSRDGDWSVNPCCASLVFAGFDNNMRFSIFGTEFMRFLDAVVSRMELLLAVITLFIAFKHVFSKTKDYSSKIIRNSLTISLLYLVQWFFYVFTRMDYHTGKIKFDSRLLKSPVVSYNVVWFVIVIVVLSLLFSLLNKRTSIENIEE